MRKLVILFLLLVLPAAAQEISVRNKPYKGEVKGRGTEALVQLAEMAKALDLPTTQEAGGWTLGGAPIPTVSESETVYIKLSDLSKAGLKVTVNKELNTIDVHRPVARSDSNSAGGSGLTLVYFGAKW